MSRPLYRDALDKSKPAGEFHRGLWFERFVDFYQVKNGVWEIPKPKDGANPKGGWIKDVVGQCGNVDELKRHALGLAERLAFLGGEYRGFETDWHFATGLGNPHPVENGFLWHPSLGVPYLPGAAVKGLVRAWIEQWDETERDRRVRDWFGVDPDTAKKSGIPEQAGGLIFFDALPVGQVWLEQDVMTPHYGKWYEEGGKIADPANEPEKVPADWHDPVPVPFLVVKSAKFVFGIAPRRPKHKDQVEPALQALENALDWLGAGAKTAVGYGRMKTAPDVKAMLDGLLAEKERESRRLQEELALNAALASLSPPAQELERAIRDKKLETDKNAFNKEAETWLSRLEADPQPDAIERLVAITRLHYKGLLENPNKTEGKKQKPAFSDWQRKLAGRLNALSQRGGAP
jgi:CRISPR-associated protein Cmr6